MIFLSAKYAKDAKTWVDAVLPDRVKILIVVRGGL